MPSRTNPVVCPFCSCLCRDLAAVWDGASGLGVEGACSTGRAAFERTVHGPGRLQAAAAQVDGVSVGLPEALAEARRLIERSCLPLVLLTGGASCEDQRTGARFARRIAACVDTPASVGDFAWHSAVAEAGLTTCTAGEMRDRTLLVWGADLSSTHPRLLERFANGQVLPPRLPHPLPTSPKNETAPPQAVFGGGGGRRPWAHGRAPLPDRSPGGFVLVESNADTPESDLDLLIGLRRSLRGREDPRLAGLLNLLRSSPAGVCLVGTGLLSQGRTAVRQLLLFFAELEAITGSRWDLLPLFEGSNPLGAQHALVGETTFPGAVRYRTAAAHGAAEFSQVDWSVQNLARRGEIDLVIWIGDDAWFGESEARGLDRLPKIVLSDHPPFWSPSVWFSTARAGVDAHGTALRFDGMPVPLRPLPSPENSSAVFEAGSRPTASALLQELGRDL